MTKRCAGVTLPSSSTIPPLFPSTTSASSPAATSPTGASGSSGLSGGQIAGIVVGAVLGGLLLLALLVLCCFCVRRRRGSQKGSVFNQPSPLRNQQTGMAFPPQNGNQMTQQAYGGEPRVARMSALEGESSSSPSNGAMAGVASRGFGDTSDSDAYADPVGRRRAPDTGRRQGSLSSQSVLGGLGDSSSPQSGSGGQFSSPEGVASGQSEQLPFFKDYYSQDEIHPNDKVATLWAYQPRAPDEFELDRGDMLKVIGIWDDGWATGVRINDRAEDFDKHKPQRDSGVSNGPDNGDSSPLATGEIKAFPVSAKSVLGILALWLIDMQLVCVCLPQHWRDTIEGDGGDEPPHGLVP